MNYTLTPPLDDSKDDEPVQSPHISSGSHPRNRYLSTSDSAQQIAFSSSQQFLIPLPESSTRSSRATSPSQSRAPSPAQLFYSSASSDTDSDPTYSPLLALSDPSWWTDDSHRRWWSRVGNRRRRKSQGYIVRASKRMVRRICRHPFVPRQPVMILLTLSLFATFGVSLTLLIIHILNPDKEPLPWRYYCSVPDSTNPPSPMSPTSIFPYLTPINYTHPPISFPPPDLDLLPPSGVFVGVFSMDSAVERRMLIRTTYASHQKSRNGAGAGDGGLGTSRTIVRFILGQPTREWDRRIKLEMEEYNDIVILPVSENMNSGKSHAYFAWAVSDAWVPPHSNPSSNLATFSYSNASSPAPRLAKHDPIQAKEVLATGNPMPWVRPDFVVKADDDAFVMLAELESRLRVQLYDAVGVQRNASAHEPLASSVVSSGTRGSYISSMQSTLNGTVEMIKRQNTTDPLIFWGYLVKNMFMGGEIYALSFSLVDWAAHDPVVKTMTKGAEDKQTTKWVKLHPQADQIRWASERCWIYDHPRSSTVYGHGFLFPSEVSRAKKSFFESLEALENEASSTVSQSVSDVRDMPGTRSAWARSTVSTFGIRYVPPLKNLTTSQSVEALVEGSYLSRLRDDPSMTADSAWRHREGGNTKYNHNRVGGTAVIHFIKKNLWFLETALALLEMDDVTELEKIRGPSSGFTSDFDSLSVDTIPGSSETGSVELRSTEMPATSHDVVVT